MDASTRLETLLGHSRVPAEEITGPEWLQLLDSITVKHGVAVKYFGWFKPVSAILNGTRDNGNMRRTPLDRVAIPEGIDTSTRCLLVHRYYKPNEGQLKTQTDIYLTQDITWVKLETRWEEKHANRRTEEITESARFTILSRDDLLILFQETPLLGFFIFGEIRKAIGEGARNASARAEFLTEMHTEAEAVENRIAIRLEKTDAT